jgi:hypothetical protein
VPIKQFYASHIKRARTIQDLVANIILDIGALYKASEAASQSSNPCPYLWIYVRQLAIVDMLWSFADASISEYLLTSTAVYSDPKSSAELR